MNIHKVILLCSFLVVGINFCYGQEYEMRFYVGANYYQGDLSPRNSRFSFSPGRLALAGMIGTKISNVFRLNLKYMTGQIGGDDSNSNLESRRIRNLRFDSPLYELGLNTEINLNAFFKKLDKYGIQLYYTTGINVFKFSPKTSVRQSSGEFILVDLQPLGTEGQGLPGYEEKYALTAFNIPFGLGFKFQLSNNIDLGFEFVPRWTFTDYLDDVSGDYVNYNELLQAGRPLAAQLANRTGEFLGTGPADVPTGQERGNPNDNDWYFFSSAFISYNFGKGYVSKKLINIDELDSTDPKEELN